MEQNKDNYLGIDRQEGEIALYGALRAIEALRPLGDDELRRAAAAVIEADIAYMRQAGVDKGAAYDEDAAFSASRCALSAALPKRQQYWDELADFAMEAWEVYLDAAGVIDWE